MLACVEMCMCASGISSFRSPITPRSATINASGRAPRTSRRNSVSAGYSPPCGKTFTVIYIFLPSECRNSAASYSPSSEKFFDAERIPNASPARYTASAPKRTAARSFSASPAGESSSGFFIFLFIMQTTFYIRINRSFRIILSQMPLAVKHEKVHNNFIEKTRGI